MTALNRVRPAAAAAQGRVPGATRRRSVRRGSAAIGTAAVGTALVAAPASLALTATADAGRGHFGSGFGGVSDRAVFVQTDNTAGNEVIAYHRSPSGALTQAGS